MPKNLSFNAVRRAGVHDRGGEGVRFSATDFAIGGGDRLPFIRPGKRNLRRNRMNRIDTIRASVKAPAQWRLLDGEGMSTIMDSQEGIEHAIRNLPESGTTPNRIVDL